MVVKISIEDTEYRLKSAMVRSTEAERWLLKAFENLAPLRHNTDDLSSEKECSQPTVELYGCFHLSDS